MRVLAFVSALLCVGCISTQALTSLGDIDIDITREFNYKDQEEADANPLPKEIEENGNTYVLDEDSVDYQQRELNTKYQETVEYTDLTVKEVPQTYTVTLGGEQYELPLEDVQYTEEQADIPTEMTVEYKGEDKKPNAPQNKTFTLDDGTEVEGVLKEVNEVEDTDTWVDFTIDGQVVIPEGATAYVYLGKVHTYNPATPLWDGYKSDLMSAIGLIVTCGIVINDSILKLDAINELRKAGVPLLEAIHEAGRRRLRPIIMTSLTTIFAMVPLLFSSDMGSELQKPLSIAMIGTMSIGTAVSLFIIPLLYWFIYRGKSGNHKPNEKHVEL